MSKELKKCHCGGKAVIEQGFGTPCILCMGCGIVLADIDIETLRVKWNTRAIEDGLMAERDEYHNQYHLCEAKLLSHKSIIKQMQAVNKQMLEALEGIKADSYPGLAAKESTLLNRIYRKARQSLAAAMEANNG